MPRSKESDLAKAEKTYRARTGVGCDCFHHKVHQNLTRETRGYVVAFLEKVERCKMTATNLHNAFLLDTEECHE